MGKFLYGPLWAKYYMDHHGQNFIWTSMGKISYEPPREKILYGPPWEKSYISLYWQNFIWTSMGKILYGSPQVEKR